jgi:hypothetical protein
MDRTAEITEQTPDLEGQCRHHGDSLRHANDAECGEADMVDAAGTWARRPWQDATIAATPGQVAFDRWRSARRQLAYPIGNASTQGATEPMPLYLDTHDHVPGLTAEAIAAAHARDVEVQAKYGVDYRHYWFDETTGKVYCLVEAPDEEAANAVHREAHGLVADSLQEVVQGA